MPSVRDSDPSAEPDSNTVDDSSPTSGLSGTTLNNGSLPSEQHEIDLLFRIAEDPRSDIHEQRYPLSPTAYYDDLHHDDGADEQQQLIEAAEEAENGSRMENRGLIATVSNETSSVPPETAQTASLRSSISSILTPLSPSTLSIAPNGRLIRRPKRSRQTVAASTENAPILRHPFMSGAVHHNINRPPHSSSSPVPNLFITRHSGETGTQSNEEPHDRPRISFPDSTEIDGLPSDCYLDARDALCPLKRSRDEAPLEHKEGRLKRLRFENDIYALQSPSELGHEWRKTFSIATTTVNSKPGSTSESAPIDYERTVQIAIGSLENPVTITCHEHLFLEVSGLHDSLCFNLRDDMITVYPEEKIPHIKARTVELFVYWLYHDRFSYPGEKACGFRQLLELYYLGHAYAMTVLKNVVIDQLISRFVEYDIPSGCTKKMYNFTPSDDQMRRLWVDFYVWEVPEKQFLAEMELGKLHPLFVQDLALAQMDKIRAMQVELTKERPVPMVAPYLKAKSAYHTRDAITGACCYRAQQEGEGYFHTVDERCQHIKYERENASLKSTLEKFRMKLERLDIENIDLKRQLRKVQEKVELLICNVGSKVRDHEFIDHGKLLWSRDFDYPESRLVVSEDCVSHRTSIREKLVKRLRI